MSIRPTSMLVVLGLLGACSASRVQSSDEPRRWIDEGARRIAHELKLEDTTVRFYLEQDRRYEWATPSLWLTFSGSAVDRLGYLKGRVASLDPLLEMGWREVPADLKLEYFGIAFDWGGHRDRYPFWPWELDRRWPRRSR